MAFVLIASERYRPLALDVLRVEKDRVAEITTFDLERVRESFGLPAELS